MSQGYEVGRGCITISPWSFRFIKIAAILFCVVFLQFFLPHKVFASGILLGDNTVGSSSLSLSSGYVDAFGPFTPNGNGQISEISTYFTNAGISVQFAIYSNVSSTPTALLGQTGIGTTVSNGWVTIPLQSSITLSTGSQYWVAAAVISSDPISMTSGTGINSYYKSSAFGTWP